MKDTATCLKSWYNERVDEYIKTNPDKIINKSPDQLKKLHKEILTFTDSFEKQISESLDKGKRPWHKQSVSDLISKKNEAAKDAKNGNVIDDNLDQALCIILNQIVVKKTYIIDRDIFNFIASQNHIIWSAEMKISMRNYQDAYQQAESILDELKSLTEQQMDQQKIEKSKIAKDKWDKASK